LKTVNQRITARFRRFKVQPARRCGAAHHWAETAKSPPSPARDDGPISRRGTTPLGAAAVRTASRAPPHAPNPAFRTAGFRRAPCIGGQP